MGKISQGILGGVSGKVGNVVGGSWKGIDYLRILPVSVANPRTPAQMDQRSKILTVINFLEPIKDFIRVGFKNYAVKMTQFNSAMSYNVKNAITGEYPDYTIDYTKALVSCGGLAPALNGIVSSTVAGLVSFEWDDNSGDGNAQSTDKALLVVYNPAKNEAVTILDGANRVTGVPEVTVPNNYSGDTVQAYIGFISEDGASVANSKFVGAVQVAS
ncbi:MAG: hypothetical protein GX126_13515 [Bacteroidales bacterium]|nr:hypothetical protein [Bacteroidales bacterium]